MEKKKYTRPEISIYSMGTLCGNGLTAASVFEGSTSGKLIDNIDVKEETETKDMDIWDKKNWGDD